MGHCRMVRDPNPWDYAMTVLKRSIATWHGMEGVFALLTYLAFITLAVLSADWTKRLLNDFFETSLKLGAIGWLAVLLFFITPYRIWRDEKQKLNEIERASQPKINIKWRVKNGNAELILTNCSMKSIPGVDVTLRNYRNPDGTNVNDVMRRIDSTDGRTSPIDLDPGNPTYFPFAKIETAAVGGNPIITIVSNSDHKIELGQEAGIKLGLAMTDAPAQPIDLRLKENGGSLLIEAWDKNRAVGNGWDLVHE